MQAHPLFPFPGLLAADSRKENLIDLMEREGFGRPSGGHPNYKIACADKTEWPTFLI
jgi:hypothetical protein